MKYVFKPVEGFSVPKPFTRCVIILLKGDCEKKGVSVREGKRVSERRRKEGRRRKEADFKHVSSEKAWPFTCDSQHEILQDKEDLT